MIPTIIHQLSEKVQAAGGSLFVVGGSVRDICLDIEPNDWDCEVHDVPQNKLEEILNKDYHVNAVGKAFGVYKLRHPELKIDISMPRTEKPNGANSHRGFDIEIDPRLPIDIAAKRRDYTVNSMAINVLDSSLVDPLDGSSDLKLKRLLHSSPQFGEDPLRVLRGMQLCARYRFSVARETAELCSTLNPEAIPQERVWEEWKKFILLGVEPSMGLNFLTDTGWIAYYPALHRMPITEQDPIWHPEGTVWDHTKLAMDCCALEREHNDREELVIGLAVLLHDCGKPFTTAPGADGRLHAYEHSEVGVAVAMHFLTQITDQPRLIEDVGELIKAHMIPQALNDKVKDSTIRRLANKIPIERLIRVGRADHFSTGFYAGREPEWDNWLRSKLKSLRITDSKPTPILMGRHLIAMGMDPGPDVGIILRDAYEAQLDGTICDLEGAKKYATAILESLDDIPF